MEKLLLEACLEAMQTGAIVGIQDMGAAGLTCSTCEMGSRGDVGIEIELDRVPQRETGMTPYEIMLSESQERMLLVAEKGREDEVFRVFEKWGLDAVEVGRVTRMAGCACCITARSWPRFPTRRSPTMRRSTSVRWSAGSRLYRAKCRKASSWRRSPISPRISSGCWPAQHLREALDLAAVRSHGADQHRGGSGRWRCRSDSHQGSQRGLAMAVFAR